MKRFLSLFIILSLSVLIFSAFTLNNAKTIRKSRREKGIKVEKREAWGKNWTNNILPRKGEPDAPIFWDFESDPEFTKVPYFSSSAWEWGAPSSGPGAAYSGTNCWATNLSDDYEINADWALTMPSQDLSAISDPKLTFYQWYSTETSFDSGWVEVSTNGGSSWTKITQSYRGSSGGWLKETVSLSSYSSETNVLIKFRFKSDGSVTYPGWYIDDVTIGEPSFSSNPYQSSFEVDEGDLSENVSAAPWEWGAPSSGPGAAYSGTKCWATNLSGDYENNVDWRLTMPSEDLSTASEPQLSFYHWYSTETSFDSGWVEVSTNGGGSWTRESPGYRGSSGGWVVGSVDLSSYSGESNVLIRFRFTSDVSMTYPGWYIDDVKVIGGISLTSHPYRSSFEGDDGDLSEKTIGGGNSAPWEWGNPTSGPLSAYDGTNCWATNLSGAYNINVDAVIVNGTNLNLQSASYGEMNFYHWYDTETFYDSGLVEVSTNSGTSWTKVSPTFRGSSGGWIEENLDISSYTSTTKFRFCFRFKSDGSITYDGWYIDSVRISIGTVTTLNFYDFEANDGGFTPDPPILYVWEWGAPTSGPGSAYHGTNCWATNLSGDYRNNADGALMNGTNLDLQNADCAEINFFHWFDTESGYDSGLVEVSTNSGTSWTKVSQTFDGSSGGWIEENCDISSYTNTNEFRFQFLFKSNSSTVSSGWYIDSVRISFGSISAINSYDFEADDGGFIPDPPSGVDLNEWEWGEPTSGPGSAYSGTKCWATDLDDNYDNNANWILLTPICDLTGWTIASLELAHWYDTESGVDDCEIEISSDGGSIWTPLRSYSGSSGGWIVDTLDITPFISATFQARFIFTSDAAVVNSGWYIDDVGINPVGGYISKDPVKVATDWLAMYISNDASYDPGTYTAATEPGHPKGADVTLIYGGEAHNPWSSYNTIRSHKTKIDYVMRQPPGGWSLVTEEGYTFDQLSNYYKGAKFFDAQTLSQKWAVTIDQDNFEVHQEIAAEGSGSNSRLRVSLTLINRAGQSRTFSFRYQWDVHVDDEDSPWVRSYFSAVPDPWEGYETQWDAGAKALPLSLEEAKDDTPDPSKVVHFLSVTDPITATVPDTLYYVSWSLANSNAFQLPYGVPDSLSGAMDAAVCYMWLGLTVAPNDLVTLTQYLLVDNPALSISLTEFTAAYIPKAHKIKVLWRTESEEDNLGFNIYRAIGEGEYVKLNKDIIEGAGNSSSPREYSLTDTDIKEIGIYHYKLEQIDIDGTVHTFGPASVDVRNYIPLISSLQSIFPNPFTTHSTSIPFVVGLQDAGKDMTIKIYNVSGRLVKTLVNGKLDPGYYTEKWNATNNEGRKVSSGVYYTVLKTGETTKIKKMVLIK